MASRSSHGSTGGRGQGQRFGQRDETDAEMLQFLQRAEQVGDRAPLGRWYELLRNWVIGAALKEALGCEAFVLVNLLITPQLPDCPSLGQNTAADNIYIVRRLYFSPSTT